MDTLYWHFSPEVLTSCRQRCFSMKLIPACVDRFTWKVTTVLIKRLVVQICVYSNNKCIINVKWFSFACNVMPLWRKQNCAKTLELKLKVHMLVLGSYSHPTILYMSLKPHWLSVPFDPVLCFSTNLITAWRSLNTKNSVWSLLSYKC